MGTQVDELLSCVDAAKGKEQRLIVVTGNPGSGKSQILREAAAKKKWDYVDCRTLVSEELIELLPAMRASKAPGLMSEILEQYDSGVILLDRVQTLFTPVLQLNPLALLRSLSEKYLLVVAWPGYYQDEKLFFNRLGETEPLKFNAEGVVIWTVKEENNGDMTC